MGIFDPSSGANPSRPVDLVSRYRRGVANATYSPSVAQAAARSGISPTMATRVAAREVGQQTASALPGLLSQEAQMMEARRLENDQKDRQAVAMGLNIGGQVLGTALNAYAPGTGSVVQGLASQGAQAYQNAGQSPGANAGGIAAQAALSAAPAVAQDAAPQPMAQAPLMQAPAPVAVTQYTAPNAAGGVPSGAQSLSMPTPVQQAVQLSANGQPIPRNLIPQRSNTSRRRAR